MEISPVTPTAGNQGPNEPDAAEKISSDFETFLNMLTVQLRNQDPLDPMDSAQFSMQLATFSGVEQQVRTNDLLTSLLDQSGNLGLSQISDWIGQEALAPTSIQFSGEPLDLYSAPVDGADSAYLVAKNELGQEVGRTAIDPDDNSIRWMGIGADGQQMLSGVYSFFVESYGGTDLLSTTQASGYSLVSGVSSNQGVLSVTLENGAVFPANSIEALRISPAGP